MVKKNTRRNSGSSIRKFAYGPMWCLLNSEAFTYRDFIKANPDFRTTTPSRCLGVYVDMGLLEEDRTERDKDHFHPVIYKSKFIVKNRRELEEKYGFLIKKKKGLTK